MSVFLVKSETDSQIEPEFLVIKPIIDGIIIVLYFLKIFFILHILVFLYCVDSFPKRMKELVGIYLLSKKYFYI